MARLIKFFAVIASVIIPFSSEAQVWKGVSDDGVLHFSNAQRSVTDKLILLPSPGVEASPLSVGVTADNPDTSMDHQRAAQRIQTSSAFEAVRTLVEEAANQHGVDEALLTAVVAAESAFDPQAVSHKGAVGLMQVMPATASRFGVNAAPGKSVEKQLRDPRTNVQAGTRYLAHLIQLFEGQLELAVAAYNAGEGAVMRAGKRVPNYRETRLYVVKVLGLYNALRSPS